MERNVKKRKLCQSGYVDFPLNDPKYFDTGEGGIYVVLVVIDNGEWSVCCAQTPDIRIFFDSFAGDDLGPRPDVFRGLSKIEWDKLSPADFERERKADNKYIRKYFPNYHVEDDNEKIAESAESTVSDEFVSKGFLLALLIGSTNWCGYHKKGRLSGNAWRCKYETLTSDGKKLYDQLRKLYSGCEIRLLTFIDT